MILINVIKKHNKEVIAICDKELLGHIYKEGEIYIDLIKYRKFYEGRPINEIEDIEKIIKNAYSINAIGVESISLLRKLGFDTSKCIYLTEKRIPHLQIYRL